MSKKQKKADSNLTVTTQKGISKSILSLLEKTVLGTPGKLRYKHTETENTVKKLSGLRFIQIKKRIRVLGTAGFIERNITYDSAPLKATYVRYLSVYNPFKKKKKSRRKKVANKTQSTLRNDIENIFKEELERPFKISDQKGLFYAYVESDNSLSRDLCCSFGFKKIRKINTFLFSRFFPKKQTGISSIDSNKYEMFRESLRHFYEEHNFVFTDSLEDFGTCFVLNHGGKGVAGIRAIPIQWKIVEIPGFKGFLMLKVLPKIPFFNRLFKPDKLKFLAFDSLWFQEKHSDKAQKLMEHACSELGFYMGMVWQDEGSITTKSLLTKNNLGLLHKINGTVKADLMVRYINMNPEDLSTIKNKPAFVSAVDMT
ncbi:hypothetical protein A8B79_11595 [Balneola sp. EhC07]|uniref:hypothetical protein n=1 Tax=Balneola sp. EhC07 TaxID=1849360 RepID=UPI0007F34152|nr:hypothetical protein [Balneola sp. EhC07]OAN59616.1 hypothetical protein A8B79_11595 [Balneola sp. EhC07]